MYSVSQRAREIGIRIALGASRSNIVRLIMGEGAQLIIIGLLLGTAMAIGLMRLLSAMLFGLNTNDPATFGQVLVVVTIASLLACALPSVRALTIRDTAG
jgi:ABC-type antimicrobial peptide transport system permease subunit